MGKLGDSIKAAAKKVNTVVKTATKNVAQTTQAAVKNVGQTTQTATKNIGSTTANIVKKVATTAATAAKKVVQVGQKVATLSLFLPMIPIALVFLKTRGIKPAKKPEDILAQVYNEISKKSFGYADHSDSFGFVSDENEQGYVEENESYGFVVTAAMVIAVIGFLKAIFEKIKAKKAAKQALSADEQEIMDQAPEIEAGLTEAKEVAGSVLDDAEAQAAAIEQKGVKDSMDILSGNTGNAMKIGLVILVILVLLYFFVFKKKG
jgi:predicted PurR-regulated permease PerM